MAKNKKSKLLVVTSYYPPEIGAASNRIYHLANGLNDSFDVTVVTPLPNYPTGKIFKEYRRSFCHKSLEDGINVHRIWTFASVSKNKFIRFFAMLSYSLALMVYFMRHRIPGRVIIQSPPLFVAFTCVRLLKSKNRTLILNVSDLWPLAGLELGAIKKGMVYSILCKIERYNYLNSNLILGQSNEIIHHVSKIYPEAKCQLYRNFPLIPHIEIPQSQTPSKKLRIVYAGLLGVAQGILKLCQNLDYSNIELHLYGSGPEEKSIENFIDKNSTLPVFFHGKLDRSTLHHELLQYDITIVPLLKRIYGSVPSKLFELTKLGLPILYFGGGEGESIVSDNNLGWIAESGNYKQLNTVIASIRTEDITRDKKKAIQNKARLLFSFEKQLEELKKVL